MSQRQFQSVSEHGNSSQMMANLDKCHLLSSEINAFTTHLKSMDLLLKIHNYVNFIIK